MGEKKSKLKQRLLAVMLVLCMSLTVLPTVPLWAAEETEKPTERSVPTEISEDAIRSDPTTDKSISVSEKNESSDNADNIALTPNEANVLFDEDVSSEPRASASTVPMSGKCGDNVKWKLEPNGNNYKLIISGKGYMDCGENMHQRPWSDDVLRTYANGKVVTSLEVKKGVKSVCGFGSCRSLKHVTLPEGLEEILLHLSHAKTTRCQITKKPWSVVWWLNV